jgi:DNA repair ATPase RecN
MIPTLDDWLEGTSKGRFSTRGTRLKALDSAIRDYHKSRSAKTRDAVGEAWETWKKNHAEIFGREGSKRNKNAMLDLLEAEFSPSGLE